MADMTIQITNLPQIRAAFRQAPRLMTIKLNEAIKKSIFQIATQSTRNAPIKTGFLRRSHFLPGAIQLSNLKAVLQPTAKYAIYVHQGTRYMRSRPFLFNAVQTEKQAVEQNFKRAVQDVLDQIARDS